MNGVYIPPGTVVHRWWMWMIITGQGEDGKWPVGYCFAKDSNYVGKLPTYRLGFYEEEYQDYVVPVDQMPEDKLIELVKWRMTYG